MGKRCNTCGETKSVKEFSKHRGSQDGFQNRCKTCVKEYDQSKKGKDANKKYRRSQAGKEAQKRHRQTEKYKLSNQRHRQTEKYKFSGQRYQKSEKGRQNKKKKDATRRTRKTQAGGSYSSDQWYNLCKFYNFRCLRCNKQFPFEKLTLDHVRPVSKGGSSDIWNTQPLCGKCNSKKHNKEIDYRKTLPDWINRDGPVWQQDTLF